MLPKEWRDCLLGDVADFRNGLNYTRTADGREVKIVGVSDFKNRTQLDNTDELDVIRLPGNLRPSDLLESGDLLFVRSNGNRELIGRCLYFPSITEELTFSGFTIRGRVDRSSLDPHFASYLMRSSAVTNQMFLGGSGTNISNLSQDILSGIEISLPSMKEQRRIAQVLSTWDMAIGATERLLANCQRRKHALVAKFLSTIEWKRVRLDEIATRVTRESDDDDHPVLMISAATGFIPQSEMYSRFMAGKSLEKYILLRQGEFAYNKGNSKTYEFGCVYPLENFKDGLVPHVYVCFAMDESICVRSFYKYLFESDYLRDQLGALVNTGVRNNGLLNIRPADFMSTKVPVPPMPEQKRIAEILGTASATVRILELSIERLRGEKAALTQQLLTGKRRVSVPQPAEAEPV